MRSRATILLQKSIGAAVSAVEVYNKPDFRYREETFAILMVNAWELLLKARVLMRNQNRIRSIYAFETRSGRARRVKQNRSGNPQTIGIGKAMDLLVADPATRFPEACRDNLLLLLEVRDNAVHFTNTDLAFAKNVQEIGTASLRNYLTLVDQWFQYDMSRFNFFLMPLSFYHEFEYATSMSVNKRSRQIENLLHYINSVARQNDAPADASFQVMLRVETKFVRSAAADAIPFVRSATEGAITIMMSEEDALRKYPLDYRALTSVLKRRYSDFSQNRKYHELRRRLAKDRRFCRTRLLDPKNPRGLRKDFFSSEVIAEFDKQYTRK